MKAEVVVVALLRVPRLRFSDTGGKIAAIQSVVSFPPRSLANLSLRREKVAVALWPGSSPTDPQTPKNSKTRKSDSKVTFGVPVKVTQKLLKSDSKVTQKWQKSGRKSNFWVTFESLSPGPRKSLLSHFFVSLNFSGFGGLWGYFRVTTVAIAVHSVNGEIAL